MHFLKGGFIDLRFRWLDNRMSRISMTHTIENITDDPQQRAAILRFLTQFEEEDRGMDFWSRRLDFWWNANPFNKPELPKGWVLNYEGSVVGFMGLIPFQYIFRDKVY